MRQQRDEESGRERKALREMLSLWRWVKEARRRQGGASTGLRLSIHKEEADAAEDAKEWEAEVAREVEEAREEAEAAAEGEARKYQERLRKWKDVHSE